MAKKKNSASQIAVWIILGLLIVGLAGFGATNFGSSVNTVASVGDREITVDRYARALNQELQRLSQQFGAPVTFAQAQAFGLDRVVLSRILSSAALENEADALGLSAGDGPVRAAVVEVPGFQGVDGSFDREGYRFALENAGLTEAEFEDSLRIDLARGLLTRAVAGGTDFPEAYIAAILAYQAETRDITWTALTEADLAEPIPDPTEEELRAYWEENPDSFMLPEIRDITYAWVTPEMIAGTIEGDDAALQRLYEARADEYNRPERRLVERLVFTTEADAEAARAAIDAGEKTLEDLVAERDLSLSDIDLGDVTEAELGVAGEAVFALEEPGLVGPVQIDLGHALFRMNGVLPAQVTPFEEAREELLVEYRIDAARRAIDTMIEDVDDLLAGGATLEELAQESELEIGELAWSEGMSEGVAAYSEFREAALAAVAGDFPEAILTDDGALFALRIDEVHEPRVEPFEEARAEVEADWRRQATVEALAVQARDVAVAMRNEGVELPVPPEDDLPPADDTPETDAGEAAPPDGDGDSAEEETPDAETPDAEATPETADGDVPTGDAEPESAEPETPEADTPDADKPEMTGEDTTPDGATPDVGTPEDTETGPDAEPDVAENTPEADPVPETPSYMTETGIGRDGFVPDTPDGFVRLIFDMEPGEIRVMEGTTAAYVIRLDAVNPPDLDAPQMAAQAAALRDRLAQTVGEDILAAYAAKLQTEAGIELNQPALTAVHSQFSQ